MQVYLNKEEMLFGICKDAHFPFLTIQRASLISTFQSIPV